MSEAERMHVAIAMMNYGGGFVARLGYALTKADSFNAERIKQAFPDYWEGYRFDASKMNLTDPNEFDKALTAGLKRVPRA